MIRAVVATDPRDFELGGLGVQDVHVLRSGKLVFTLTCGLDSGRLEKVHRVFADIVGAIERELLEELAAAGVPSTKGVEEERSTPNDVLFSWLHLSDIHMGHGDKGHQWNQKMVLQELKKDIEAAKGRGVPGPDVILVTGDVAFSGAVRQADEYDRAERWLLEIAGSAGLEPRQVFVVPGNHDVQRNVADSDKDVMRLLSGLRAPSITLDEALDDDCDRERLRRRQDNFLRFAQSFGAWDTDLYWSAEVKGSSGLRVRLIGLNTALMSQDDTDRNALALGNEQLAKTLAADGADPTPPLTVVLSHHPFDWLADGQETRAWLESRAHVHLCGHRHRADARFLVSGRGQGFATVDAGAVHNEAGDTVGHGYSFAAVCAEPNGTVVLRVWHRIWSKKNKVFMLDAENVPEASQFATLPLGFRLPATPDSSTQDGLDTGSPDDPAHASALVEALAEGAADSERAPHALKMPELRGLRLDPAMPATGPNRALTELHAQAEKGLLVVVAGAGVSMAATPAAPGWATLLQTAVDACQEYGLLTETLAARQRALLSETNVDVWLRVASLVEKKLKDSGDFGAWLYDTFKDLAPTNKTLIEALADLGCPILTTNYDGLLEAVTGRESCTWREPDEMARALRHEKPRIVHLHGRYEAPDSVVLGFQGYERIGGHAALQSLQKAIAIGRSMLFVGCGGGLADPNLGPLLTWYRSTFPNESAHRHFLLVREGDVDAVKELLRASAARIAVLSFGAGHDDLPVFIRRLVRHTPPRLSLLVDTYRRRDAGTTGPGRDEVRELIDASRLSEARARVDAALAEVEEVLAVDADSAEHRRRRAELQSQRATILILLDDRDGARAQLEAIEAADLEDRPRASAAINLSALGSRDRAQALLAGATGEECAKARRQIALEEDPTALPPDADPRLWIVAAHELAARGRRGEAGRLARDVVLNVDAGPARLRLMATRLLHDWLVLSATELPADQPLLPPGEREAAITLIGSEIGALAETVWEGPARRMFEQLRDAHLWSTSLPSQRKHLEERLAEVETNLPSGVTPPEWLRALASLGEGASDRDLEALVARWPHNAVLLEELAERFAGAGCLDRALPHARAAREALPGPRQRWLLATCEADAGNVDEATALAADLATIDAPEVLWLRGALAYRNKDHEAALALLGALLGKDPSRVKARILRADSLAMLGHRDDAAQEAWEAFTQDDGRLSIDDLGMVWRLLSRAGQLDEVTTTRVEALARALHERFRSQPRAEQLRLQILAQLGFPSDQPSVDYPLMVEAGLLYRGTSFDELATLLRDSRERAENAWNLYRGGMLSVGTLCMWTGTDVFGLVVGVARHPGGARLSPPARSHATGVPLAGRVMLLGDLELALLVHLGLVDAVAGAVGRLETFTDVRDRLGRLRSELPLGLQPGVHKRAEALRAALLKDPRVEYRGEHPTTDDLTWAASKGLAVIHHEQPQGDVRWVPTAALPRLIGLPPADRATWAERASGEHDGAPAVLPDRVAVTWVALFYEIDHRGALGPLLDALPDGGRLIVGPETVASLANKIRQGESAAAAADLAVRTWDAVTRLEREGKLVARPRPTVPAEVLELRTPEPDSVLTDPWSWRESQLRPDEAPGLLLTADFVTGAWFAEGAPLALVVSLGWTPAAYVAAHARYDGLSDQQIHLPELIRQLADTRTVDEADADRGLEELTRLGFAEALDARLLLRTARNVDGDLSHARVSRLLDGVEQNLTVEGHPGQPFLLILLSTAYADAAWRAFTSATEGFATTDANRVIEGLLYRIERVEPTAPGASDMVLSALATATRAQPSATIVPGRDELRPGVVAVGAGSPAAQAWDAVGRWVRSSPRRLCAVERAISAGLVDAVTAPNREGATAALHIALQALDLGTQASFDPHHVGWFTRLALSAHQADPTLRQSGLRLESKADPSQAREYDYASILRRAAAMLEATDGQLPPEPYVVVPLVHDQAVRIPLELALLAASDVAVRQHGPDVARRWATRDGRVDAALRTWSDEAASDEKRQEAAVALARSPARLLEADPQWFFAWRRVVRSLDHYPRGLGDLRELLNEPPPTVDSSPLGLLQDRLQNPPSASWRPDEAYFVLAPAAALVPLDVAPVLFDWPHGQMRDDDRGRRSLAFLSWLEHPDDVLAAHLAAAFHVLRTEATLSGALAANDQIIDFRTRLPKLAGETLAHASAPPPEGTLAWAEVALYRECLRVVDFIAASGQPVSLYQRLWLTMRLAAWVTDRLRVAAPEMRAEFLRELVARESKHPEGVPWWPAGGGPAPQDALAGRFHIDALHPRGWESPHSERQPVLLAMRTATVLFALRWSDIAVSPILGDRAHASTFSSPQLERQLVALASRPPSTYERELRKVAPRVSCLYGRPDPDDPQAVIAVCDQALSLLLSVAGPSAITRLGADARSRFINAVADSESPLPRFLVGQLAKALRTIDADLSPEEVGSLREALRLLRGDTGAVTTTAIDVTLLLAAHERRIPEDWVTDALGRALAEEDTESSKSEQLGYLYQVVAGADPEALAGVVERILAAAARPIDALQPLGAVGLHDDTVRARAGAIVAAHASDETLFADPRYHGLMQLFGFEPRR